MALTRSLLVAGPRCGYPRKRVPPPPTRLKGALLQHAQQFDLQILRQLPYFVQKQGSALGQFETSPLAGDRPGERAFLMAEEFAFKHARIEGHAVDRDKGLVLARRGIVDGTGHQFLARAGLARYEHGGAAGRGTLDHLQDPADGPAFADDLVQTGNGLPDWRAKACSGAGSGRTAWPWSRKAAVPRWKRAWKCSRRPRPSWPPRPASMVPKAVMMSTGMCG